MNAHKLEFTAGQVAGFRLRRHHLLQPDESNPVRICSAIGGVQAQLSSAAELQLWARRHDLSRDEIRSSLWERRTLVKTMLMRRTLHWVPAREFPAYIAALRTSRIAALFRLMEKFGVTRKQLEQLNGVVVDVLQDGRLSKQELISRIRPRVSSAVRAWMDKVSNPLTPALTEGLICYGPGHGSQATFVRVDHWVPTPKSSDAEKSKRILLRRYLTAYGPARLRDFCSWSGIASKEAKSVWQTLAEELAEVTVHGERAFLLKSDMGALSTAATDGPVLRLLPSFDPYLLAHVNKTHLLTDLHYKLVYRAAGWISPVVLLNGRVAGLWSVRRSKSRSQLQIEPFTKFTRWHRAEIEKEVQSMSDFLNTSFDLIWSSE